MNPLFIFPKHAVRALVTLVAAGTLIVAAGCGAAGTTTVEAAETREFHERESEGAVCVHLAGNRNTGQLEFLLLR